MKELEKEGLDINGFQYELGGFTLYECPPRWITAETNFLMDALFIFHEKNILPVQGAWSDQPFWFAEAYKIFINELNNRPKETTE